MATFPRRVAIGDFDVGSVDEVTHGKIFIAIYGVLATYFSCVMIRLMLTLAPVVCIIAGIALSELFRKAGESVRENLLDFDTMLEEEKEKEKERQTS